ncbi:MAG: response regulator transcription factor [Verrucomicrobium sp.]|nr:response regulator transcription factor [Verrucomicrobium sp.]
MSHSTPAFSAALPIAVVDDHSIICAVFRSIAEDAPDLTFAWSAGTIAIGLESLHRQQPGVLIVDVNLPDGNGYDLIHQALNHYADLKILMVSTHEETIYAERARDAGARGYVNKNTSPDELLEAIYAIRSGATYFNPSVATFAA